jgi:hypothetical protein
MEPNELGYYATPFGPMGKNLSRIGPVFSYKRRLVILLLKVREY